MTIRLRWKGNQEAQKAADTAFAKLKPKHKKKRKPTRKQRKHFCAHSVKHPSTPEARERAIEAAEQRKFCRLVANW